MKLTAWERFPYPVRKAWRIMRITTVLILVISLHLSAKTTAQKITLSSNNISIEQFFNQLEKQTGYSFLLENGVISKEEKISVNVKDAPLETVLDQTLKPINLSYKIENKTVYILKSSEPISSTNGNLGTPPIDIHGRVTDSLGNPLAGASVFVKGTRKGAITNAIGEFTLKEVSDDKTLVISFTGYSNKEYKANNSSFNITLNRSNNPLDQVQVIAYGTTTQRLSTGDVTTVTSKEIEQQPVSNPLAALEGRVPGLSIFQNTGAPGGSFSVQIRGQSSIFNGNDPFYVIDGVPYPSQTLGTINPTLRNGNPLNFINPSDIESIEVLKDADATSIYGSRAANGAILITTKRGSGGAAKVNLNVYTGVGKVTRMMDLMNTQQYLEMRHEAFLNDGTSPNPNADFDLTFWDTTRYTNWQKVLIGNSAHYYDAQGSISGGNTNTQYLIGAGFHQESTVFPVGQQDGPDQKASAHFSISTMTSNKKFKAALTGSYVADQNRVSGYDQTINAIGLAPNAPPLYNSDGTLNWAPITPGQAGTWINPLATTATNYIGSTYNLVSNAILSYLVIPGLEIKTSFGYNNIQTTEIYSVPSTAYDPGNHNPSVYSSFNNAYIRSWIIEPQVNYQLHIGQGLFKALLGSTFEKNQNDAQQLFATGFSSDAFLGDIQAATSLSVPSIVSAIYKYEAIFGSLNYNWADKYILNITGRRDGSSRFGPANQFANFGSIGAAWIFSKENFIRDAIPFLSFGKLRGSYGTSGNDQIGNYGFYDLYTNTQYPYQGMQGLYPANLYNPNYAWELDKKLEGGIELGFLKDRINLQGSIFRNRSGNQLAYTPLSLVTGFNSIQSNLPALVQNTGLEAYLNTINVKGKNFTWSSSINITIPNNKLISFPNLASSPFANSFIIGKPITIIRVFQYAGVNDTTGLYQFADSKGNKTYNPAYPNDLNTIINTAPKFYGGLLNSFQYKSFSLDFFFQFVKQIAPNFNNYYGGMPGVLANEPISVLERWQKSGDNKRYQMFSQNYGGTAYPQLSIAQQSDFGYSDASFIRLKNLSLSWQLPQTWRQKVHLESCRLYVQGQNLLTFTKYYGLDPETHNLSLPPLRVFTGGIQVTL